MMDAEAGVLDGEVVVGVQDEMGADFFGELREPGGELCGGEGWFSDVIALEASSDQRGHCGGLARIGFLGGDGYQMHGGRM